MRRVRPWAWLSLLLILFAAPVADAQRELEAAIPPGTDVDLSADSLSWDAEGIAVAEGNVRLSAGAFHVAAERVRYDSTLGVASFEGGLTFLEGSQIARASRGQFDLVTGVGTLEDVSLYSKSEAPSPQEALSLDEAGIAAWGHNDLTVVAIRVEREADGAWVASHPQVTTCDCGDDPPSWTLGASSATVIPGERVRLTWPVLRARGLPIAAFPWLSLPLSDRKTGFLAPDVNFSTTRGFSYEQPFFLVLGRSWDTTLSAGYFVGNRDEPEGGGPAVEKAFRGPRFSSELRYVPRQGTIGRTFVSYARDLSERENRTGGSIPADRWALQLDQTDEWAAGVSDRISLSLVSDRDYVRDFTEDVILRDDQALMSSAWIAKREGVGLLALEGVYLQDLRPAVPQGIRAPAGFVEDSSLFGTGRRNTFARLPALAADVARWQLPGNLGLSFHVGAARFAPLTAAGFGDEGLDGLGPGELDWRGPDAGEGNGLVDPGERLALNRLSLRPTLSLPIVAAPYVSLTPYAGWRQQLYLYDDASDGSAGWGVLGANARTELARSFGDSLRHAWIPELEVRSLLPGHERNPPVIPYDELDIRPERAFTQGRISLGSRLDWQMADRRRLVVEGRIGQELMLAPELEAAEAFAQLAVSTTPVRMAGLLRWSPADGRLREVSADAAWGDRRGDELRLGYRRLAEGGSSRLRAGPDELFAPFPEERLVAGIPFAEPGIEQIRAGATVVPVQGLSLHYDLLFLPTLETDRLLQQRAGFLYTSACDCWSAGLDVLVKRDGESWSPRLELGGLIRY